MIVNCPYCRDQAEFWEHSKLIYNGQDFGPIYICLPCDAYVGCHPDGRPLGRLANAELRIWKQRAHYWFDPLWKAKSKRERVTKQHARFLAYKWLAKEMGLPMEECHIGMFDITQCKRVVDLCRPFFS